MFPYYVRLDRQSEAPLVLIDYPYLTPEAALETGRRYARLQAACDGEAVDLCVIDAADDLIARERFQPNRRRAVSGQGVPATAVA